MSAPPQNDIIVAVASGWSRAARALVRLSGHDLVRRVSPILTHLPESPWRVQRAEIVLTDVGVLPCLAIRYDAPRSFTGEDSIELLIPGSELLAERVVRAFCGLSETGKGEEEEVAGCVREARPGEFAARAYLNGKMSLEQAEGVAALIAADSEDQLISAERLMSGTTGQAFRTWSDECATLLALVEAGIDFTDQEDVVPIAPRALNTRTSALLSAIDEHLGDASGSEQHATARRVVLAGPPSAGKSTLFNALLGRDRAITSAAPGTTRDVLVEPLDLSREGGMREPSGTGVGGAGLAGVVSLVDIAGLDTALGPLIGGDTGASAEVRAAAQAAAREAIERADVVLWCDPTGQFRDDRVASTLTAHAALIRVRTKADLALVQPAVATDDSSSVLSVCALDGWHLAALRGAIADACWSGRQYQGACVVARHRRTLAIARSRLMAARALVEANGASHSLARPELIAGELRAALDAIGELTGAISPDDVIGRIFSTFCVGK